MNAANTPQADLLSDLLRDVSRSFYLTLRVLPKPVRRQIGLAYLMARTADTIADTELIPVAERLNALDAYSESLKSGDLSLLEFGSLASNQASFSEQSLLARAREPFAVLASFSETDQTLVRRVLEVIIGGQRLDLERFGASKEGGGVAALATMGDLDDYTWRVAGCVGEFWTLICSEHLFDVACEEQNQLLSDGIRFGKGLQLVNILRDLPKDLREGRCYIPADLLEKQGLEASDLLKPECYEAFRELYGELVDMGDRHLEAGWRYTCALPFWQVRLRLACAWPVLIGMRTFGLLRGRNVLDPAIRIKVQRAEIYRIVFSTLCRFFRPHAWARLPDKWK